MALGSIFFEARKAALATTTKQISIADLPDVLKGKTFSIEEKLSETIDYYTDRFSFLSCLIRTTARISLLKTRRSLKALAQTMTMHEIEDAWTFIVNSEQNEIQQGFESGKFERLGAFSNEKVFIMADRKINEVVLILPK